MIFLEHIKKTYQSAFVTTEALKDINLIIPTGEMTAVMGTSGSGKTTLLNILGVMDRPTSGVYRFETEKEQIEVTGLSRRGLDSFQRTHIGYVFQQSALLQDYTVRENIEMPLRARNVPFRERAEIVKNAMERMEISDVAKKLPSRISGGQQQRCAIARAIVSGGDLILADEPTGALDQATGRKIMEYLVELKNEGKTIVVVTHDSNVASFADRVVVIRDGVIEAE